MQRRPCIWHIVMGLACVAAGLAPEYGSARAMDADVELTQGQAVRLVSDGKLRPLSQPTEVVSADSATTDPMRSGQWPAGMPMCSDLEERYPSDGDVHAACWQNVRGQSGCHVWNEHFHSDRPIDWTGSCRSGVPDGQGTLSAPRTGADGTGHGPSTGSGVFVNGRRAGRWVERGEWSEGGVWESEGPYVEDVKQGRWVERKEWSNGDEWEGEGPYVEGVRQGRWVERGEWRDGGVWEDEGPYVEGVKQGRWVERGEWSDGGVWEHEGPYVEGVKQGRWVERGEWSDGSISVYEGPYVEGVKQGRWVAHAEWNGRAWVEEGQYIEGVRQGRWVIRYSDGDTYALLYEDGEIIGVDE